MDDRVMVIISRYREDVAWAEALGYDYTVYDKSGQGLPGAVPLPNIGREGHTWMTHIVRRYHSLAPVNVFLQGDPFDHINEHGRGTVEQLRTMIEEVVVREIPFRGFAWFRIKCDRLGRPHHLHELKSRGRWAGWGRDIPVAEVFETLFDARAPEGIVARGATGCFAVTAERVHARPLAFYRHALSLFESDPDDAHNTGHAFERLWHFVFNGNTAWNKIYPQEPGDLA
ncbi:DUF3431 domain-containing protein [Pseudodesulfovibrio sp. F-1]|uniref:DUF3431 domain-containing protein n=1 Tax=Pseudodesulfovibrio alkaliphilus TaxID=2661613 RepID=A0A7K1KNG9_9BACT|nr:DUF3431 domain-containing protein [Pseudodesulfovibrio alkaliphilus]MUM77629.1 DUF3431 domain-containing protein [Pseudodesulfovibrio alkaliphilus]